MTKQKNNKNKTKQTVDFLVWYRPICLKSLVFSVFENDFSKIAHDTASTQKT